MLKLITSDDRCNLFIKLLEDSNMKRIIPFVVLVGLGGCLSGSDWTAFVYPDIQNIPNADQVQNFTIGNYSSFEECQVAAISRVQSNYATSGRQGDYQCGYKCTVRAEFGGLFTCKETKK